MIFTQPLIISFELPYWIEEFSNTYKETIDVNKKMEFVIAASRSNIEKKTGGPFAAAVFEQESGRLVSLGVNLVTTQGLSMLHAEVVAISLAQRKLKTYDLGCSYLPSHELVISAEPCLMCLGAILWSGIRHVATGAFSNDARSFGFDEGPLCYNWKQELLMRGITVVTNIKRQEAYAVLKQYKDSGGHIYNSRES